MDADQLRQLIEEKHAIVAEGDPYDYLGVSDEATDEEIKRAYFELAKLLHPDRVSRAGVTELVEKSATVFRALTSAYNTLSDPRQRAEVIRQRRAGGKGEAATTKDSAEERRIFTHRGDLMLKRHAYGEAESFFRRALELDANNAEVLVRLGIALFYNTERPESKRREEARGLWEKAEKLAANPARAKYYLALYWKAKNDPDKMSKLLNAAVKKEPGFVEAKRELRLLEMRKGRTQAAPSFLSRLWAELTRKR